MVVVFSPDGFVSDSGARIQVWWFCFRHKGVVGKKLKSMKDFGLLNEDRCFIIAEGGINHNGNIDLAKQLMDLAFETGSVITCR